MNRFTGGICVAILLIANAHAQAEHDYTALTIPEFRQTLLDLGAYLDARKGSNLAQQFASFTDEQLQTILPAFSHPGRLRDAVAALRAGTTPASRLKGNAVGVLPRAAFPACAVDTIISTSVGALCTPAYPDPTNSAWQNLVNPPNTFGAFSPTDYASISSQQCSVTVETNLSQVVSAMNGAVAASTPVCSIIPAPFNAACWAPVAALAIAGAVSTGIFADCQEQDGLVNAAEINAAFHNTVTIYDKLGAVDSHITAVDNKLSNSLTNLDTHLTNVNNQITGEFTALSAQLVTLVNQLSTQITNSTDLLNSDLRQVMKLQLTPDGRREINPLILTCTGTNCPNVLAKCPAAGCSWNNVGPLP